MDWSVWIPTITVGAAVAAYALKRWITAAIEKSVQHDYDRKIEGVRSALRAAEQSLQSELRGKEAEIAALRDAVLVGRSQRQALVDKRRVEAVERVWTAVVALGAYKLVAAMAAMIKFDLAAKKVDDAKHRKFFELLASSAPTKYDNPAKHEQLFVSPLAWALFSAYQMILLGAYTRMKTLEMGLENAADMLDHASVKRIMLAALPHRRDFIEKNKVEVYYYLLDELEHKLRDELLRTLEGSAADEASLMQASAIMDGIEQVRSSRLQAVASAQTSARG